VNANNGDCHRKDNGNAQHPIKAPKKYVTGYGRSPGENTISNRAADSTTIFTLQRASVPRSRHFTYGFALAFGGASA
jgi:hypothetical protein